MIQLGVIHPKYLNFVAIASLSEYLDTGRCNTLEGADGAYNIYENEIRSNRVIEQLDQVITSLERIRQNQYKAYDMLTYVQHSAALISEKLTTAVNSLEKIETNTETVVETVDSIRITNEINEYHNSVIQANSVISKDIAAATAFF